MIFHISIAADDPKRTATMLAELWRGEAFRSRWSARAAGSRMPATTAARRSKSIRATSRSIRPTRAGEQRHEPVSRNGPFHAAVATPLEHRGGRGNRPPLRLPHLALPARTVVPGDRILGRQCADARNADARNAAEYQARHVQNWRPCLPGQDHARGRPIEDAKPPRRAAARSAGPTRGRAGACSQRAARSASAGSPSGSAASDRCRGSNRRRPARSRGSTRRRRKARSGRACSLCATSPRPRRLPLTASIVAAEVSPPTAR